MFLLALKTNRQKKMDTLRSDIIHSTHRSMKKSVITVRSCRTKAFLQRSIELCPSSHPQVIREPCVRLPAHSKACWAQLFGSDLHFINAHEALTGALVNANEHISLLRGQSPSFDQVNIGERCEGIFPQRDGGERKTGGFFKPLPVPHICLNKPGD